MTDTTTKTTEPDLAFFSRYLKFRDTTQKQLWDQSRKTLEGLLQGFREARVAAHEAERVVATKYNLFSILKLNFSEVKFHTPILANLLDPRGSHAQGDLFLRLFVQNCVPVAYHQQLLSVSPFDVKMTSEVRNFYGQPDICLLSLNPRNRFALIIENKILAGDQYKQLYRYYQYATIQLGLPDSSVCIVYLTPNGRPVSFGDLSPDEQDKLSPVVTSIGYHSHIIPVLQDALDQIGADKLKQTVIQYIQTLDNI